MQTFVLIARMLVSTSTSLNPSWTRLSYASWRSTRSARVHCLFCNRPFATMLKSLSLSGITKNCSHASKHSTDTVTWFVTPRVCPPDLTQDPEQVLENVKEARQPHPPSYRSVDRVCRCGLKYQRVKTRNRSTRTVLSAKCSCGASLSLAL